MNSKHPDKDLDHIFKDAIDPVETEPSDKFWNRTFEDIIKRENKVYGKQMRSWKAISYLLGAAIILLAFYTFYIHDRINNVEKQLTEVEEKQAIADRTITKNITGAATITAGNGTAALLNKQVTTNHVSGGTTNATGTNYIVAGASNNNSTTITKNSNAENNKPEGLTRMNPNYSNPGSNNVGADNKPLNSSYGFGNKTPPGNYYSQSNSISDTSKDSNTSVLAVSPIDSSSLTAQNEKPAVTIQKEDTALLADNKNGVDSLNLPAQMSKQAGSKTTLSHLYVSAFFSPGLLHNIISDNNPSGNITANTIKAGEEEEMTYTTGLKLGYDLSKHWSVLTGVYYHVSSFSILPTVVYAQWKGSTASYPIVTSAGTLEMPNSVSQYANDSLKASGNSSYAYVGIPMEVSYDFLPGHNFDFYVEGGFAANILLQTQTSLNWESTSDRGNCSVDYCDGLQNVFFVYNMGIGATYKISKGLSIFAEPGMQGPLTPISKNNPIATYPYVFDLTLGLTYYF